MRVIPVLDLANGTAVHARAGFRTDYAPVESALVSERPASALALARAYRALGVRTCYVADLDAIAQLAPQRRLLRGLADPGTGFGEGLLVDAGVTSVQEALEVLSSASAVVVGLETLRSFADLADIIATVGSAPVVFSLDLRRGKPVVLASNQDSFSDQTPATEVVARAVTAGARTILVLDLSRVGTGSGIDVALIAGLKRSFPAVSFLAAGGVRGRNDLNRLAEAGCDGALVASALHVGALSAQDVAEVEGR